MNYNADAINSLQIELRNIKELDIKSLRQLVLNPAHDSLISSTEEIDEELRTLICTGSIDNHKMNQHIDGINFAIKSYLILDIRNNPIPKSTPLSAFEWMGHNETDLKLPKNSRQVVPF